MVQVLIMVLKVIGLGALLSIPGVAFALWMKKHGGPNLWWGAVGLGLFAALLYVTGPGDITGLGCLVLIAFFTTVLMYKLWPFERDEEESSP